MVVSHLVNWLSPMKERVTIVTGEHGTYTDLTFYANGVRPTEWDSITTFRGVSEGDIIRYALAKREPLRLEHEAFRDAVLGVRQDVVTMREGVRTLQVAEAVLESAATGRTVALSA